MRISIHENYPGPCDVYLDGIKQENVIACDVEEGYVEIAITDERRLFMPVRGSIPTETKHGAVRIELIGAQQPKPLSDNERRVEAKRALRGFF